MLCEISESYGFFITWITFTLLGLLSMLILSTMIFIPYYYKPTFERWQYKSNPVFPSPLLVKKEIIHMSKGLVVATLCPALTLFFTSLGYSKGYCGLSGDGLSGGGDGNPWNPFENRGVKPLGIFIQTIIIFCFTDFYEYVYHYMGHKYSFLWSVHKHHHKFYNPSPFAVIADEYFDQFVRTLPMIFLPILLKINMDLLFLIFSTLFYGYGVYLHWGYESQSKILSAHNPVFNTAYQHYIHHAISSKNK